MNAQADVELESWHAAGHSVVIDYDPEVLNGIRSEAIDGLNRLSRGGLEIGGILFGRRDGDRITITSHCPVPCEYALGPTFTLSANDERELMSLLAAPGRQAVGWYHSHTRSEISLSAKDVQFFDRYFPEPWQIALVVKPHRFDPTRAGFFFRQTDGSIRADSSYREFRLKPTEGARESARESTRICPEVQESKPTRPPARPAVVTPLSHRPETPPGRRRWIFAAALSAAAVLTATFSFFYANSLRQPPANLALRVFDTAGQLRIDWDRDAPAVRRAESAIIEINDGGTKRSEALDAAQLRIGSVTYLRSSGDVAVRLRVLSPDQRVFDEATRFIGPPIQVTTAVKVGTADRQVDARPRVRRPKKPAPSRATDPSPPGVLATPKLVDPPLQGLGSDGK